MQQRRWELKADLNGYYIQLKEIEEHIHGLNEASDKLKKLNSHHKFMKRASYLADSQIKILNVEADDLVYFIGLVENRLIGHNVQYFGKCCCVACKEGIYD